MTTGRCEVCGSYTKVTEVGLGVGSSGPRKMVLMCPPCAAKSAVAIAAAGGKVVVVDGHSGRTSAARTSRSSGSSFWPTVITIGVIAGMVALGYAACA